MNRGWDQLGPDGVPSELSRPLSRAAIVGLAVLAWLPLLGLGWLLLQLV